MHAYNRYQSIVYQDEQLLYHLMMTCCMCYVYIFIWLHNYKVDNYRGYTYH